MQAEGGKPNVTHPVSNYSSFDFFDLKFDHSSYSKKFTASNLKRRLFLTREHICKIITSFKILHHSNYVLIDTVLYSYRLDRD